MQIILVVIVIYILMTFPEVAIIAGLILAAIYFSDKYKIVEKDPKETAKKEEKEDWTQDWNPKKAAEEELEKKIKPGFKSDPETKEKQEKVADHIEKMTEIADLEIDIEDLEECLKDRPTSESKFSLAEKKTLLKQLEKSAGLREQPKKEPEPPKKTTRTVQAHSTDMTDVEIHAVMEELNEL